MHLQGTSQLRGGFSGQQLRSWPTQTQLEIWVLLKTSTVLKRFLWRTLCSHSWKALQSWLCNQQAARLRPGMPAVTCV